MKAIVVLNCGSGSVHRVQGRRPRPRAWPRPSRRGPRADGAGRARAAASRKRPAPPHAADADTVVFGGGDGTVSTGAAALAGGPKALGVLPLGTFNHFARDLGIPLELEDAVRTIAVGHVREVDVGEVNGRPFVNNSSIGLYPEMVRVRDELRRHHGMRKGTAMLGAAREVLRDPPFLRVDLRVLDDVARVRTPFVFVGNNRYEMDALRAGRAAPRWTAAS